MARLIGQDPILRKEFEERIRRKVQQKKNLMKEQIDEEIPGVLSWAVKPLAGLAFDLKQSENLDKGVSGEFNVFLHAKFRLSNEWVIINDVVLEPEPDQLTQIDHIIIGPPGLFIIETKAWNGSFTAYRDNWKRRSGKAWVKCSSPTKQNLYHTKAIAKWLEGTGILNIDAPSKDWIIPVVVFTKAKWLKTTDCSMPIFQGISELIEYLRQRTARHLDQEHIDRLTKLIQYPRLNKALRYNQIKWTGTDGVTHPMEAEAESPAIPEYFEGKTKDGKRYVRIPGTLEQANAVFEYFKSTYPKAEPPRKDRFKKHTYFFYLS